MSGPFGSSQWMYASGAEEGQSLRFEDGDSAYLSWTPASAGNRKTWTWSGWVKRGNITSFSILFGAGTGTILDTNWLGFSSNTLFYSVNDGTYKVATSAVFRDPLAWYHVVLSVDTTQATASNRIKLYINGVQETSLSFATYPPQNDDSEINSATLHVLGARYRTSIDGHYDGYLANVTFIDGQALDPTSFGEYDDTLWKPKSDADIQSLTFGTNGFYLPFKQTTEAEGFSTVTYTGNGGTQSIEGVGFEPDLVWIKARNFAGHHVLVDSVRGTFSANRYGRLFSNTTGAEDVSSSDTVTSLDADGFGVNSAGSGSYVNDTGDSYVAWCWDAGSGSPVSNTDGSITSTVKANTAKGFSIVTWTGNGTSGQVDSVGHGLSQPAEIYFTKQRNAIRSWFTFSDATGSWKYGFLDTTAALSSTGQYSDATKLYLSGTSTNQSGGTYVAYCFHSVSGYSSIGSYSGTGATGNSITGLGFKPAWLMYKRSDSTGNWIIHDNTRDVDDDQNKRLYPNLSNAEQTVSPQDVTFDSDGFTMNTTGSDGNASGGTYIYMAFADTRDATFFGDTSGNGNNWTPNALNNTDVVLDSPVSGGNFAVSNVLDNDRANLTASEGNLKIVKATASTSPRSASTIGVKSGKWYWETRWSSFGGTGNYYLITGVTTKEQWTTTSNSYNTVGYAGSNDATVNGKSFTTTNGSFGGYVTYGSGYTTSGDIIGTALDLDGGTVTFYLNGTSQGSISLPSTDEEWFGYTTTDGTSNYATMHFNFGQDSSFAGNETPQGNTDDNGVGDFYYAPPSGFLCLKTSSLPAATITAPDEYFNTVLWTGNAADRSITGVGFQPDFTWVKNRSNAYHHGLFDNVRGANKVLKSSDTSAEVTYTEQLTSFDTDGFSLGDNSDSGNYVNISGHTYVAWNWLAGNGTVSNTSGSVTSTVSANPTSGFSIITYTGDGSASASSVGHGLSQTPDMVILKDRGNAVNWFVWHNDGSTTRRLEGLNTTSASTSPVYYSADADTINWSGSTADFNGSGKNYVMYAFHSVEGYSKIGSYTGNGSADGTFVHCGFRPSLVMTKRTNSTGNWQIHDAVRDIDNEVEARLYPNVSNAEITADFADFTANGFKLRNSGSDTNASGSTYIFLAFASAPFSKSNAR